MTLQRCFRPVFSLFSACCFGAFLAASACSQEPAAAPADANTINWLVVDLPPHFSFIGGRAPRRADELRNGEVDGFLRLLIGQMPQYQHELVDANFTRFEAMARRGQPICSTLHLRTPERLSWLYFTPLHPNLSSRQLHVIVQRDQLARFQSQEPGPPRVLQFAELLQRRDLVGLLARDRSYGPRIDALLLAQGERAPKTIVVPRGQNLLAMLRARRMDYTLEYESTVNDYLRNNNNSSSNSNGSDAGQELVKLVIAEGRSSTMANAACSRSPAGRRQIEAIDAAMRKLAQDPRRDALIRSWQPNLDEQDSAAMKRFMDERARGGVQIE